METINTSDSSSNNASNNSNKYKNWIYGMVALLVIAGLFFAYNQSEQKAPGDYTFEEIMNLPAEEQKEAFEKQIKDLEERLTNLTQGTEEGAESALESTKHRIYIKLAEAQNQLGRYQDALNSLGNIPESQQNNPDVLKAYAVAHKGLGANDKATEAFKKALEEDNTDTEIWLAYLSSATDLPNDQLDGLYRQAIVATKSNVDVMISYAKFSERIGNKDQAVAAWETAINGNPEKESEYRAEIARLRQ